MDKITSTMLEDILAYVKTLNIDDDADFPKQIGGVNIKNSIDIDALSENLTEYWNQSVKDLKDKITKHYENIAAPSDSKGNNMKVKHDAGWNFNKNENGDISLIDRDYVSPNQNFYTEQYLQARSDDIESVLKNKDLLDFTAQSDELNILITRLLMPQYARRVEVEDLNRNFWVIGQNLSLLNQVISNLNDGVLKEMLDEIVNLWQNVYRLWQAVAFLLEYIDNSVNTSQIQNKNTKVRVLMTYGFGTDSEELSKLKTQYASNGNMIDFNNNTAKAFGILPYIKEVRLNDKYLYYMPYNQLLTDDILNSLDVSSETKPIDAGIKYTKLDEEFLYGFSNDNKNGKNLIQIDTSTPIRNTREILEEIRARNFVLVYITDTPIDYLPQVQQFENPNTSFLSFYRDYLYYVSDSDVGQPLSQTLNTPQEGQMTYRTWAQVGGLKNVDFSGRNPFENIINENIDDNVKQSCNYVLHNILKDWEETPENKRPDTFIKTVLKSSNLTELKENLDAITPSEPNNEDKKSETIFSTIVDDFYKICQFYINKREISDPIPSYFNPQNLDSTTYTLTNDNAATVQKMIDGVQALDQEQSPNKDGRYYYLSNVDFNALTNQNIAAQIQWDLLSLVIDENCFGDNSTNNLSGSWGESGASDVGFGRSYMYPRKQANHLWIDFVENSYYKNAATSPSKIGSFTFNEISDEVKQDGVDYAPQWYDKTCYDLDITVPFTTPKNIKYEDFVRAGKPYPNIAKIGSQTISRFETVDGKTQLSKKYYEEILNNNYTGVSSNLVNTIKGYNSQYTELVGEQGIAAEGFYGQTASNYLEEISTLEGNTVPLYYLNCLQYGIASSDLIDYVHAYEGQTRKANHIFVENPNLNLRYLNSSHNWQEIEWVLTKDKTGFFKIPERDKVDPLRIQTFIARIGDFYPVGNPTNTVVQTELTLNKKFNKAANYDINTYGLGSYNMSQADWINSYVSNSKQNTYALKYTDYQDYNDSTTKLKSSWCINQLTLSGNISEQQKSLTTKNLLNSAVNYLKRLYNKKDTFETETGNANYNTYMNNKIAITKLGKNAWAGENGSQWSENVLCHLLYILDGTIIPMGTLERSDGYFDALTLSFDNRPLKCFSKTSSKSTQFRHLVISLDSTLTPQIITIDQGETGETVYYAIPKRLTGYVLWFDRNQAGSWESSGNETDGKAVFNNKIPATPYIDQKEGFLTQTAIKEKYEGSTILFSTDPDEPDKKYDTTTYEEQQGLYKKYFKSDLNFPTFVKQAFLQVTDPKDLAKPEYKNVAYERLVGYVPFYIVQEAPNKSEEDDILRSKGLSTTDYYLSTIEGLPSKISKMVVLNRLAKVRFTGQTKDNQGFSDAPLGENFGYLLPETSLYSGSDPVNIDNPQPMGGGTEQLAYFVKTDSNNGGTT